MNEEQGIAVDEMLDDLRRVLSRCDELQVGQRAAIQLDLAIHLLMQERARGRADVLA